MRDFKLISRQFLLFIIDMLVVLFCGYLALNLRFDFDVPKSVYQMPFYHIIIDMVITFIYFVMFKLYSSLWKYASVNELINVVMACFFSCLTCFLYKELFGIVLPKTFYFIDFMLLLVFVGATRMFYRVTRYFKEYFNKEKNVRTMLIGAGQASDLLIKDIEINSKIPNKIVCIIDDNKKKKNRNLHRIPIVGDRSTIVENALKYNVQEIIIAIPSANALEIKNIVEICQETGCSLKILSGVYQQITKNPVKNLKDVSYEQLLGRDPVKVNQSGIKEFIAGKVVIVTGGGGSIGSELCRQIAPKKPKQLIIFDIYENNAYDIQLELKSRYPELDLVVLIGSVRDVERLDKVFKKYKPEIVFHAAAHKHVPLMEESPNEAIKNNCLGTLNTAKMADKYGALRFVLISTDKAVRPTNVMGATKRICEMIIQSYNAKSKTEYVAVRFGNVLGSNGSVIPLFLKQIEEGGPVTVTHKEITRFFMTIPEAVMLVLEAALLAKGGEIFILDMGSPVKIYDLAESLIKLKGLKPNVDVEIKITGLRPGEKLYEEILMSEEGLQDTANKLIHIGKPIEFDQGKFLKNLDELITYAYKNNEDIKEKLSEIVPTYTITENK